MEQLYLDEIVCSMLDLQTVSAGIGNFVWAGWVWACSNLSPLVSFDYSCSLRFLSFLAVQRRNIASSFYPMRYRRGC